MIEEAALDLERSDPIPRRRDQVVGLGLEEDIAGLIDVSGVPREEVAAVRKLDKLNDAAQFAGKAAGAGFVRQQNR